MIEKFNVHNRWTGEVAFTAEIEVTSDMSRGWQLRLAVVWALANSVPCTDLNLNGADFTGWKCPEGSRFVRSSFIGSHFDGSRFVRSSFIGSHFVGSHFDGSSFDGSHFDGSSFDGSRFDGSRFIGSHFVGSHFDGSRFVGSHFDGSRFDGSRFDGSHFVGSHFVRSSFIGSRFDGSRFIGSHFDGSRFVRSSFIGSHFVGSHFDGSRFVGSHFDGSRFDGSRFDGEGDAKQDFLSIISDARDEIAGLIAALRDGRINGSVYSGDCACLVGTIANLRGVDVRTLHCDSSRPAEKWFLMISEGDKPGYSSPGGYASGKALEWAEEYIAALQQKDRDDDQ